MASHQPDPLYRFLNGEVVRHYAGEDTHICGPSGHIGVCYDATSGTLLRHGNGEQVAAWADKQRAKFAKADLDMDDWQIETLLFPATQPILDELNRCVDTSGRVLRLKDFLEQQSPQESAPTP
jgi:hypothetical protein